MIGTKTLVDDTLLKELSVETKKIGSRVLVKQTPEHPSFMSDIIDVVVMPQTLFYRIKFMEYYLLYSCNAVKALKELGNNFPFVPDYQLAIAYVLHLEPDHSNTMAVNPIKFRSELEFQRPSSLPETLRKPEML